LWKLEESNVTALDRAALHDLARNHQEADIPARTQAQVPVPAEDVHVASSPLVRLRDDRLDLPIGDWSIDRRHMHERVLLAPVEVPPLLRLRPVQAENEPDVRRIALLAVSEHSRLPVSALVRAKPQDLELPCS